MTKTMSTERPKSISGVTGLVRDEEVRQALAQVRAESGNQMGSCGGVAGGWGN